RYYGETLSSTDDLKTTACCTAAAPPQHVKELLAGVHPEVSARYYGCGLVLPEALEGLRILDLGCGAGRDVFVLSQLVGPSGKVVGVDMTVEQLEVAEQHRDWHANAYGYDESNVEFIEGNIEKLGETNLVEGTFDLIVSNCVINLAVDKRAVLRSAFRLLSPGGEMYFSDIYADRRIPVALTNDPVLYGECLSGAMYWNDFLQLARDCDFTDPRLLEHEPVDITDPAVQGLLGDIRFRSATCRLFPVEDLEPGQENYGQTATYLGTIANHPDSLRLDGQQNFMSRQQTPVSGNTAQILSSTRFSDHFDLNGDRSQHLGAFRESNGPDLFVASAQQSTRNSCC
ncbi:MAG: methyltransferase domain-containing protein, partial [Gammaproteobacteria bacterium]